MTVFKDAEALYDILGGFFSDRVRWTDEAHLIHQVGGPITFIFERPAAQICWVPEAASAEPEEPSSERAPFRLVLGAAGPTPLLTFRQDGDTAHRFWLGLLDLQQALARQQVRAQGPLSRAMKLLPHLDAIYPLYPEYLTSRGHGDLLPPAAGLRR